MRIAVMELNIIRGKPSKSVTGELRDTETIKRSSEGGDWKSTCQDNSLVAYPTARPVLKTISGGDSGDEFNAKGILSPNG